jgi:ABC-type molybdate transport system substrate-binding protein
MKKLYCLILALVLSACALSPGEKTQLRVLLAGSLIVPFDKLERAA